VGTEAFEINFHCVIRHLSSFSAPLPHYAVKLISNASVPTETQLKCLRSIGVGAQSTLGGHKIFAPKICIKNHQNAQILNDSCLKNYHNA